MAGGVHCSLPRSYHIHSSDVVAQLMFCVTDLAAQCCSGSKEAAAAAYGQGTSWKQVESKQLAALEGLHSFQSSQSQAAGLWLRPPLHHTSALNDVPGLHLTVHNQLLNGPCCHHQSPRE